MSTATNHKNGEAMSDYMGIQYKSAEPTNLDYRKAALDASIKWLGNRHTISSYVIELATEFEDFLRNGRTR